MPCPKLRFCDAFDVPDSVFDALNTFEVSDAFDALDVYHSFDTLGILLRFVFLTCLECSGGSMNFV